MEKTFDASRAEARIYEDWERKGCFKAGANASRDETFCIMIPPPNVTGSLHVGHAFNNTLQDILTRWHRMRGFDTLWQPGQDHAGIATQMVVERKLATEGNASRRDMGREDFLKKVWEWKTESGDTIITQLKRLGASCDWSRNAFTMSGAPNAPEGQEGNFHDAVIRVFVEMYNKGYIYRGKRLVNWDPHFETAISDLEVEQIEKDGYMWRLRYPLEDGETYEHPIEFDEDGNVTDTETRDYLTVATTRPETMLGDTGVAVHPDDRRYAHLVGKHVILPITGRRVPIVADSYADPEKGTGAVKITPAHDFNDWDVGQRTGLRVINVMDTRASMALRGNGDFAEGCPEDMIAAAIERLDGADRYEARDAIVTWAEDNGWLDGIDADRHMVPHGDRSKVSVEPFLTDQWFVDTAKIVEPALEAVRDGRTNIMPEQHRKVYFNWLENIQPWTISRQLWWGHQIPVWYGFDLGAGGFVDDEGDNALDQVEMFRLLDAQTLLKGTERHHAAMDFDGVTGQFGDVIAALPAPLNHARVVEAPDRSAAAQMLAESLATYTVDQDPTRLLYPVWRDPDVLDTWFSSGLWPIGTLGWPEQTPELERYFPTSVLISGFDIIFFWVARMMMMQLAVVGEVPFRDVYVHALVRDEKGRKMSKSIGNVLDPLDLIDKYGADALRFTMASMAAMGRDVKLSDERVAGYRNFGTKLWNAARFAEMNDCKPVAGFDPGAVTQTVNKWIVGEIARARVAHDEALAAYRFNDAAGGLYATTWGKVCDWYLEFAKPLFASGDDTVIAETRATMAWVIDQCLILLHPVMPFITEELWGQIATRDKMLIHADWPAYGEELVDAEADAEITWVIGLIDEIRSVRAQMHVPAGMKVPLLQAELDAGGQAAWDRNAAIIQRIARVDSLTVVDALPKGAVTVAVEGGVFGLPIADIIDVEEEKARLEKLLGKLAKELGGLRGRLGNPKFAESAPAEVVEETRNNLAAREEEEGKIRDALARLEEIG
ncbi:valine--tRNA ligase [Rhodophyticola porphyridii]|uniref:Valine--tRNA ligase n=1 Tax=Rhodophyticola porphyridii TaxID=1852017 RepID=A0A3L9YA38_9RHOB|nr:valine--tRNA ligase [Rhodophyticola porphyridii]RMA44148.1 valine--tRNA ligase [Rhodophyticola porphyridii]